MSRLTAAEFEARYGELVRGEYSELGTPRLLKTALGSRRPAISVSDGLLKVWFSQYRVPPGAVRVGSSAELNEKYGPEVEELAKCHESGYKLMRAFSSGIRRCASRSGSRKHG